MLKKIRAKLAPYSKAIVGYVAPLVVAAVAKYGLNVDVDEVAAILTSLITGTAVFAKANK